MKRSIITVTLSLLVSTFSMANTLKIESVITEISESAAQVPPIAESIHRLNQNRVNNLRNGISEGRWQTIANASIVGDAVLILDDAGRIFVLDSNENQPTFSSSLTAMGHLFFNEVVDSAK